jgi:hypothetical protein
VRIDVRHQRGAEQLGVPPPPPLGPRSPVPGASHNPFEWDAQTTRAWILSLDPALEPVADLLYVDGVALRDLVALSDSALATRGVASVFARTRVLREARTLAVGGRSHQHAHGTFARMWAAPPPPPPPPPSSSGAGSAAAARAAPTDAPPAPRRTGAPLRGK